MQWGVLASDDGSEVLNAMARMSLAGSIARAVVPFADISFSRDDRTGVMI
jgi:hypothetical protein